MPMTAFALLATLLLTPPQSSYEPGATFRLFDVGEGMNELMSLVPGQTANLDRLVPRLEFKDDDFFGFKDNFIVQIRAQIEVKQAGRVAFRITSDDGSILRVGDKVVADNDGVHAPVAVEGSVDLKAGWHNLEIDFFEAGGGQELKLEVRMPGSNAYQVVDSSMLRAPAGLTRVVSPGTKRVVRPGGTARPGNGMPLDKLHPGYTIMTVRPEGWQPQVGALAFRKDGKLLVGTFKPNQSGRFDPELKDGEVWLLDGVTGKDRSKITRKRIAWDLQEPLGMAVVGDNIYVSTRTEIVQLIDKNGDDVIDEKKTVGKGWKTDNYHHFTFGLAEKDGWLYAALSTSITFNAPGINGPNPRFRGSAFRVDPAKFNPGQPMANIEFLTSGHRTPNGVSNGPNGLILVGENQGSWQPSNKVNVIEPGAFFGHINNATFKNEQYPNGGVPGIFDHLRLKEPAIYLPQGEIGNSPGQIITIPKGPFENQILISDVKFGGLRRGWLEKVDGQWQGGAVDFSQGFEVGTNRLVWGPDGSLYIGGIGATETWAWTNPVTKAWTTYGLQKITPNGKTAFEVEKVSATPKGFRVEFTRPLGREARDAKRYTVRQWRYEPTVEYGGPKVDRENLAVSKVTLLPGNDAVEVEVHGLKEGRVVYLNFDLPSSRRETLWASEVWYTLNRIPKPMVKDQTALVVPAPKVLVFSKTAGFRHDSIPDGIAAIRKLGTERGFSVDATEDASVFNLENLIKYDAVVFLNTTGDVLGDMEQSAFQRYIRGGGGFVGIHSASDTEYGWPWYGQLCGAYFKSHPHIQQADIHVEDRAHPSTNFLPNPWVRVDEWYDFTANPRPNVRVLANIDTKSYTGSSMGDHPIIWCQEFEGGRSWYTALGHTKETFREELFLRHLYEGILWAANGRRPADATPLTDLADWGAPQGWTNVGAAKLDPAEPRRMVSEPGSGVLFSELGRGAGLLTKEKYEDVQLHVEFMVPKSGNSGVYLMGRYEVQILDSHGVPDKDLQSSMAGSIYERWKDEKGYEGKPPMVNAARPAGEWQSFDILFRAPRFKDGKKVEDAMFVEVRQNGVIVQSRVTVSGPTRASIAEDEVASAPIFLQGDHGPIAYRNMWVRRVKL